MPPVFTAAEESLALRKRALSQLAGAAPRTTERGSPAAALAALHTLASSPDTAADALALLHELQVHQVELELQHEELQRSRAELETELGRQQRLVDQAPVAYLTLDAHSRVHTLNHAAARLLGASRDALPGEALTRFLSPHSAQALTALLAGVRGGTATRSCGLQLAAGLPPAPGLLAVACADPDGDGFLLVLVAPEPPGIGNAAS